MNNSASMKQPDKLQSIPEPPVSSSPVPSLVIDLRWNRIRIHKQTLHLLGDPDYIQILLNPATHAIAIRKSSEGEHQAYKISSRSLRTKQCCELHSKILLNTMSDVFLYLSLNQIYRISGKYNTRNNLAHFNLKDAMCINSSEEEHITDEPKS